MRELIVSADNKCRWDYPRPTKRRGHDTVDCTINSSAGTIDIVTPARSKVSLRLNAAGELQGLFAPQPWFEPYAITMKRGPAP